MVPWTAAASYKYLWHTEWGLRPYASSGGNGTAWLWTKGMVDTLGPLLRNSTAWPRGCYLPHNLQCGGIRGTLALVHHVGRNIGDIGARQRGVWTGHSTDGSIFVYWKRTPSVNASNLDTVGIWRPDEDIWLGWYTHQHVQDGDYGVPTLLHNRGALRGGLRPQDDRRGSHLPE